MGRLIGRAGRAVAVLLLVVGVAAVLIYWTAYRSVDDVRLVVTGIPQLSWNGSDPAQPRIGIGAEHMMTVINRGRRQAAIVSARLIVVDGPDHATCTNLPEVTIGAAYLDYNLEPLVLVPGAIAVRALTLKPAASKEPPVFEPMFGFPEGKTLRIISCIELHVVTPNVSERVRIAAGDTVFNADGTGVSTNPSEDMTTLIRRRGRLTQR